MLYTPQCHHSDNRSNEFVAPTLGESEGGEKHALKMHDRAVEAVALVWMLEDLQLLAWLGLGLELGLGLGLATNTNPDPNPNQLLAFRGQDEDAPAA